MNKRAVGWLLGCVLLLLAAFMLVPALVAAWFREPAAFHGCLWSALLTAACGGILTVAFHGATHTHDGRVDYFRREGLAAVGLSWVLAALVGALPFLFSGTLTSPTAAFFEAASGFTTTGATILTGEEIEALPRGIVFWRSFTHWIGGIGIVLVFVLLFPAGGRSLFRSEVPGISREAVQQRVRDSALGLVRIYVTLTLVQVALLWFLQRDLFDAFIHAFGTLATGGFSSHGESVFYYRSWKVELVIVVFMFAAGVNFGLYDTFVRQGFRGAVRAALTSSEIRAYGAIVGAAVVTIGLILWFWGGSNGDPQSELPNYASLGQAFRDSLFTVVSVQTSTGFGTANFDRWPEVCRVLLMLLAVCGACAGSTGGGLKVVRFLILAKAALQEVRRFARPRAIHAVRLDGGSLPNSTVRMVLAYCGLWSLVFGLGTLAVAATGLEMPRGFEGDVLETAATSVIATLNNIGPGLAAVGPYGNYAFMPESAKLILGFLMILGRLEFYAVVILFAPRFWRS